MLLSSAVDTCEGDRGLDHAKGKVKGLKIIQKVKMFQRKILLKNIVIRIPAATRSVVHYRNDLPPLFFRNITDIKRNLLLETIKINLELGIWSGVSVSVYVCMCVCVCVCVCVGGGGV